MFKNLLAALAFVALLAPFSVVNAGVVNDNLEVSFMTGIMVDPGTGGSVSAVIMPKKLNFFLEPAIDAGLSSRMISTKQTGQDMTTHIGPSGCLIELLCVSYVYVFQDKDMRLNFTANLLEIDALAGLFSGN